MIGLRRCRNLYTLVIVVAGLFYINWLLNVTDWSRLEKFEKKIRKLSIQQETLEFELFEAFDQQNFMQTNGHFMLIGVKNLPNNRENNINKKQILAFNDLSSIFKLLYSSQAFIMDINVFENLFFDEISKESVFHQNIVYNASSVDISNYILSNKKHHLTFGIKFQNFNKLNQVNAIFFIRYSNF